MLLAPVRPTFRRQRYLVSWIPYGAAVRLRLAVPIPMQVVLYNSFRFLPSRAGSWGSRDAINKMRPQPHTLPGRGYAYWRSRSRCLSPPLPRDDLAFRELSIGRRSDTENLFGCVGLMGALSRFRDWIVINRCYWTLKVPWCTESWLMRGLHY